jgi:hypothetical protein
LSFRKPEKKWNPLLEACLHIVTDR